MTKVNNASSNPWIIVVVEDDEEIRNQIKEYLSDDMFAGRGVSIQLYDDIEKAKSLIKERKADLVILDVYQGNQDPRAEKIGVLVLKEIQESGFVPVIFYTALPEQVESYESKFVHIVGKTQGLPVLKNAIKRLFNIKIIPFTRNIYDYLDISLSRYMWEYAQQRWDSIEAIADKPEIMRIIINRLACEVASAEIIHPAEYYIVPPISNHLLLGDICKSNIDGNDVYFILVWPSCDLVEDTTSDPPRELKTASIIVLKPELLSDSPEYEKWHNDPEKGRRKLKDLLKNRRHQWKDKGILTPERYHYLPGVWDMPHFIVDFQRFEYKSIQEFKEYERIATLASPFAEELSNRFLRYIGRLGTADLNFDSILNCLNKE